MSEKSIRYIVYVLKTGLFILPILSLIVASSLFFPFITGKNFFFRIMVEILFFFWVFVACFDKNYRPRKSSILIAISATLFFLVLATVFGANHYRSFWSNYERMEGLISHIHLFLYFLILTSVFKKEKDWKWFFIDLIGISFILAIYGFLQFFGIFEIHQGGPRLDATLGNTTYFAIFLIFHLFLISWLFIRARNLWIRSGLMILFTLEVILLFITATRGAILGLIGGAIIFAVLMSVFTTNKKIRCGALGLFFLLATLIVLFSALRNFSFIQNNLIFSRLANISITEATTKSRLTIWQMSFNGFLERPFFGWGPENFNLVFNKYYEPKLWNSEPWFDRAHDIIFDWLISTGILGFLAYWSIWGAAIFVVIKAYKKKQFTPVETSLFFALFTAYASHNIFVFDNITSYFLFFSVLGYLHFRHGKMETEQEPSKDARPGNIQNAGFLSYVLITLAFVAVAFSLYFANLKPLLACRQLLTALGETGTVRGTDVDFIIGEFDKVFSYNTFGNNEAREQLGSYAERIVASPGIASQDKTKAITKAIKEMEKQVRESPDDARSWLFLTSLYTKSNQLDNALSAALKAKELSPQKQQTRFVIADIYLAAGQYDKAFEVLKEAYEMDRNYTEAAKNLAIASIVANKKDLGEKILGVPEKNWVASFGNETQFINVYAKAGDFKRVKELWQGLILKQPNNAQLRLGLAATYLQLGDRQNAIKELETIIKLEPKFKEQGEYYISEIRAGRNP
jgi:teichuronic acid biosynthesis protein TuaE